MANQALLDKQYKIPSEVLNFINKTLMNNPQAEGNKRAKFILKNGFMTYQALKRLKNFFDYFNIETGDKIQYALAGGDLMRNYIETTLNQDRTGTNRSKEIKRDISANPNSELMPYQNPRLDETGLEHLVRTIDAEIIHQIVNEDKKVNKDNDKNNKKANKNDDKKPSNQKNAIAVIVNKDNKILLLKREEIKDGFGSKQWGLVGGTIEKGETAQQAVQREIEEETGLTIDKYVKSFNISRNNENGTNKENIFACRYNGDPTEIVLNSEHTNYGWFDMSEIEFLDTVPNLKEYILLVFTKY